MAKKLREHTQAKTIKNSQSSGLFTKRRLQIALGVLWLIDGLLQLQSRMFTSDFATQVIAPAAQGQPRFVSSVIHFGIRIFLLHPALFNSFAALTQLGLGFLILWKHTAKYGLVLSVLWSLVVWSVGEGYGGIFSAHTSLLMGAPGAVILYAILAIAALPRANNEKEPEAKAEPAYWLAFVWLTLWIGGGVYQLLPGQNSLTNLKSMLLGNATGAPGWLASLDIHTANFLNHFGTFSNSMAGVHMNTMQMAQMSTEQGSGYPFILMIAALQFSVGIFVLSRSLRKYAIGVGIFSSLVFWVIGQSLGGYFTGLATDPESAPLFILLGLAILSSSMLDNQLSKLWLKIETALV